MLKSKNSIIFLLIASVVISVISLITVAYLMGRDLSSEDASASVDVVETALAQDKTYSSNKICDTAMNGKPISFCVPKYLFPKQSAEVSFYYYGEEISTKSWIISVCNRNYEYTGNGSTIDFRVPSNKCTINIYFAPNTDEETSFTKEYDPILSTRSFNIGNPVYPNRIGEDYLFVDFEGDLARGLASKGVERAQIEEVVWEYKFNSDVCTAFVWSQNPSLDLKYKGKVYPQSSGRCKVTYTANVVTCDDCENGPKVVYRASKVLNIQIAKQGILPSPTSVWTMP